MIHYIYQFWRLTVVYARQSVADEKCKVCILALHVKYLYKTVEEFVSMSFIVLYEAIDSNKYAFSLVVVWSGLFS